MGHSERTRIVVVEEDARWRNYLSVVLGDPVGCACVGIHSSVEGALRNLSLERPDICVLAWERSALQLAEGVFQFKAADRRLQLVVFCQSRDFRLLSSLLAAGADAIVSKADAPLKVLEAVDSVRRGGSFLSACVTRILVESFRRVEGFRRDLDGLSQREMDVLKQLSTGRTDQEIASSLGIAVRTVGTHLQHIYEKLEVHNRAAAVAKYLCGAAPAHGPARKASRRVESGVLHVAQGDESVPSP
jgi:DNA-binding NarL/FixJ family response regulator